jgi:hypothetical protein
MHKYKVMGSTYLTENHTIAMPYVIETTNKTLAEIIKKYEKQNYWCKTDNSIFKVVQILEITEDDESY